MGCGHDIRGHGCKGEMVRLVPENGWQRKSIWTWWTRVRDSEVTDLDTKSSRELNEYLNVHHILWCVRYCGGRKGLKEIPVPQTV